MKNIFFKFIYIFLISFVYLFLVRNIFAFEFVKSTNNPLNVSYIDNYTSELQHHIFKEGSVYKGIFVINRPPETYYSLGYFESVNGIDWQMKKEILNTGDDLSNPSVIKTQTGYHLFVSRYDNRTVYRIYSSVCDTDFNCSSNLIPVIMPDVNNYSEKNGVFAGRPFKQDDRTFLFFGAWGEDGFKIKLAYSDDLISWQRCPYAFLYGGDGPFSYQENNDLYLFFHRSDNSGIQVAKTVLPLSCNSTFEEQEYLLIKDKLYDQRHLIFPSVINENNNLLLYYTGLGGDYRWRLNLACTGQGCPTPTAIPTPTITPTPTPIPEKIPIIIIPGFMASWNREAILHNQKVDYSAWKIQSFVKEYTGLVNTLKNIGYQENVDLFLFPYDWRQSVEKTVDDLNSYLQEKIWNNKPSQKINIVGHSLGGLVGRIFTQKNKSKLNKIISVGSPHQGVVQVYKPIEAGEIDRENTFLWLAEKIILILNKSKIESDRVTIHNKFPVAKDMFPTFNFLKDSQGVEISINNLTIKNIFLSPYNQNFYDIFPLFSAIYGEKDNKTPAGYITVPQNNFDKLLGNYSDGKPKGSYFDLGDYTILSKSASQDTDSEKLNFDHGELIYKKEAIKKILDLLYIQYIDSQVVEGKGTVIDSSLIFLIRSPAAMEVVYNGVTYQEQDGIVFIENASGGDYRLNVKGIEKGKYTVIIGQIGKEKDLWSEIKGEITSNPPASQIDSYNFNFNNVFPKPINDPNLLIDEITADLNNFTSYKIAEVNYAKNDLKLAKKYLQDNDLKKLNSILLLVHSRLMIVRDKISEENNKSQILNIIEKLEKLFVISLQDYVSDQKTINAIKAQNIGYRKNVNDQSLKILNWQSNGRDVSRHLSLIKDINSRFLDLADYLKFSKYSNAQIVLKTISYLISEVKKL